LSRHFYFGMTALAFLLGCQSVTPADDAPARIINSNDASRNELQQAINNAVGASVTLADDTFAKSSVLTIENRPPKSMSNPNPQGRIMETPPQFQLVKNGGDCILVDRRDQSRQILSRTSCELE